MFRKGSDNRYLLQKYGGLAFQFVAGIAIGIFVGKWVDGKFLQGRAIFIWLLPLIVIFFLLYSLIKDVLKK